MSSSLSLAVLALLSIRWATIQAESVYCGNPELCVNKRFLRFGRSLAADGPYNYYRSLRALTLPYQDKRFLRFGRSGQSNDDQMLQDALLQLALEYVQNQQESFRKKRSTGDVVFKDSSDNSLNIRKKRSTELDEPEEELDVKKRDADLADMEENKRFMRFGRGADSGEAIEAQKKFMRFGRNSLDDDNDDEGLEKRFMRFGKRFMRFGREPFSDKRFMRFGKRQDGDSENMNNDKRFMRFGKRFMRFGKRVPLAEYNSKFFDDNNNDVPDKRFMRFGKRFMRFGKSFPDVYGDKRFMRFGKRFMRFGRSFEDDSDEPEKRFMRFGKRFMRFGKRDTREQESKLRLTQSHSNS